MCYLYEFVVILGIPPCICLLGACQLHIPAKVYGSAHTCLLDCYENDGDL